MSRRVQEYGYTYHTVPLTASKSASTTAATTAATAASSVVSDTKQPTATAEAVPAKTSEIGVESRTKRGRSASARAVVSTTPIPSEFQFLCDRIVERGLMSTAPEQIIVNEYVPGILFAIVCVLLSTFMCVFIRSAVPRDLID
jgi:hypothetical protein